MYHLVHYLFEDLPLDQFYIFHPTKMSVFPKDITTTINDYLYTEIEDDPNQDYVWRLQESTQLCYFIEHEGAIYVNADRDSKYEDHPEFMSFENPQLEWKKCGLIVLSAEDPETFLNLRNTHPELFL